VVGRGVNRVAVGLGMIPRGEVGLIFAGIGATLILPTADGAGRSVISAGDVRCGRHHGRHNHADNAARAQVINEASQKPTTPKR